jgi:hypothetical protein
MEVAAATPLADPARVPMPNLASKGVIDYTLDLRGTGNLPPEAAAVINEQEAR